ncbi:MAG: DUF721 domain-containing protein, partial [Bryobacteraceae bacterium]
PKRRARMQKRSSFYPLTPNQKGVPAPDRSASYPGSFFDEKMLKCARIDIGSMERAGQSFAKLKASKSISAEELACAAWPVAVGNTIARHSTAVALVRDKLVVEVEDVTWQKPLFQLQGQILRRMSEFLGQGLIADLEVRIAKQRRPPQRAMQLTTGNTGDDADEIGDSVMRMVYRQARKKATA